LAAMTGSPPPEETAQERRERLDILDRIAAAAGSDLEAVSLSDYRLLHERFGEELPSPRVIWELFGGWQRLREFAQVDGYPDVR
jgi:hypothetical protein